MRPNRDEETGQFSEEYPREAFLQAVESHEMATTTQVAETVDCSYDLAYQRLGDLADEGEIKKRNVGGSFVWLQK